MVAVPGAPGEFSVKTSHCGRPPVVTIVVTSVAVSLAVLVSPPPETVAVLVCGDVALAATSTVRVIAGYEDPAANALLRVQESVARTQLQPVPAIPVAVKPAGSVSVTVTVPLVAAVPELVAVIV